MVRRTIVSQFQSDPPVSGGTRVISGGPLYRADEVLSLLEHPKTTTTLWSQKCRADVAKLDFETSDVAVLIGQALKTGAFLNSEWCTSKPDGPWAACDAYVIKRTEWIQYARKELDVTYYIKFCIGKTGAILLVASCHLEENRRSK
jgi:hypothetical protein